MVNSPLIRPYFLGGVALGGYPYIPMTLGMVCTKSWILVMLPRGRISKKQSLKALHAMYDLWIRVLGQCDLDRQSEDAINNIL